MSRPSIRIHNLETDEIIDREMNDEEFARHQSLIASYEKEKAEIETKESQKAALLERLGINEDEAKLLIS